MINLRITKLSRYLRALVPALVLALSSHSATARDIWNGVDTSESLKGSGTAADPYQVWTGADLKYLANRVNASSGRWQKVYVVQMDDIDMNGWEWTPIGNGTYPFYGYYDGQGHTISNMMLKLSSYGTDALACVGFIGNLGAQAWVKNLCFDHAVITSDPYINTGVDYRAGIVAGSMESGSSITYCVVNNSEITDGGNNVLLRTLFAGGIVGNAEISYGTYNNNVSGLSAYKGPITVDYVAANVNVNLANTHIKPSASQYTQFNYGGITGRIRRGSIHDIPDHCVASGQVNAPRSTISPLFGIMRGNADNTKSGKYMARAYSGEYARDNQGSTNDNDSYSVLGRDADLDITNRLYTLFAIYNPEEQAFVNLDNSTPGGTDCVFGTRTIEPNGAEGGDETTKKFNYANVCANATDLGMQSYQGVNHAQYFDADQLAQIASTLAMLNGGAGGAKFSWSFVKKQVIFIGDEQIGAERYTARRFRLLVDNHDNAKTYGFRVTLTDADGRESVHTLVPGQSTMTDDVLNLSLTDLGADLTFFSLPNNYRSFRAELLDASSSTISEYTQAINSLSFSIEREVDLSFGTRHYDLNATLNCADDLPAYSAGLDNPYISYYWEIQLADGRWVPFRGSEFEVATGTTVPSRASLATSFVGPLRLWVYSHEPGVNPAGSAGVLMSRSLSATGTPQDFIEQIIKGLHLSVDLSQVAGGTEGPFDHAAYYISSGGSNALYGFDSPGITGALSDTAVPMLHFSARIVDQFGNDWTDVENAYELSRWRLQWEYRVPGMADYAPLNGTYEYIAPDNYNGLMSEITATIPVDADGHTGQYQVSDHARQLVVHPNVLGRTANFWVRIRLYDVLNDPEGLYPTESFYEYSQVGVFLERGDNCYIGWPGGRVTGNMIPFTSADTFTWYSSTDITDANSWTQVGEEIHVPDSQAERNVTIQNIDPTLFYKLVYRSQTGMEVSGIIGPQNVVFVYDRAYTALKKPYTSFVQYDPTSHAYYPDGNDINDGLTPRTAVKTMARAFEILDANGTVATNRIVVMGAFFDPDFLDFKKSPYNKSNIPFRYNKPVTITGQYGKNIKNGLLFFGATPGANDFQIALQAPQQWENIDIYDGNEGTSMKCLYLWNHDFTMGQKVRMCHFNYISTDGGLNTATKSVNFTLVVGRMENNLLMSPTDAGRIDYSGNVDERYTTVKLYSGAYGRIIGASRNNAIHPVSNNVYAHPAAPHRARITIDIPHPSGFEMEYAPSWHSDATATTYMYNCEIGMMVGGQTDGSVYADTEVNLYNGHIARYVAGNISYGRPIDGAPDDGFFGSTVMNIYGGQIDELYGGSLGRQLTETNPNPVEAFFYGQSIINLYGGAVGDEVLRNGRIFAAGAGAVSGLGADWDINARYGEKAYTVDQFIPYFNTQGRLSYGTFEDVTAPGCEMPKMQILDSATDTYVQFDLAHTKTEINLYGGVVYGNVYGGGYGYSDKQYLTFDKAPYRELEVNASNGQPVRQCLAGVLYGTSSVRLLRNPRGGANPVVTGNVYGGGSGSDNYITDLLEELAKGTSPYIAEQFDFTRVAQVYGQSSVTIEAGVVEGEVFASSMGMAQYSSMAALYGNTELTMSGGEVKGNIYGGGMYSDLRSYKIGGNTLGGNTEVKISGGVIGNCVFGAGRGSDDSASNVDGSTSVTITGGRFSPVPFLDEEADDLYAASNRKNFNIYGGGYVNGSVGSTSVTITTSPLVSEASLGLQEGETWPDVWDDLLYRRFCVYGGGWGEHTLVKTNASVDINIDHVQEGLFTDPDARTAVTSLVPGQTFFDVAGGGYSGNVGYWVNEDGTPISELDNPTAKDYHRFEGGNVKVTIQGAPFIRKVVGGAFYATVYNTETRVISGSIGNVYGGALLGYVHNNARTFIGSSSSPFYHDLSSDPDAAIHNSRLFIRENVYGGNDVKGIVGTEFWTRDFDDPSLPEVTERDDNGPLFRSDVSDAENKGVTMYILGGSILGDVYGAGNGHYRGYYVPGWCRYNDGPERHYNFVRANGDTDGTKTGRIYRSRPMVGSVKMHIGGNSADDRVMIYGDVYGGGRSCTIGQWNSVLAPEDPRRLVKGGFLHMNYGSHVTVKGSVYLGSQGAMFTTMHTVPAGIDLATFKGETTADLNRLGDVAYDHWYFSNVLGHYVPGFPMPGFTDGNYDMYGMHMMRGYMKNLEFNGNTELTFYDDVFQHDAGGEIIYITDYEGNQYPKRRPWVPAELAYESYDASDVVFTNFFAGGKSGSMTNNVVMQYCYDTQQPIPVGSENEPTHDHETFGAIYRVTLPRGITILDKVVGGVEDAIFKVYPYTDPSYTSLNTEGDPAYVFEGGFVTQNAYTFDLLVYHDLYGTVGSSVPATDYADLSKVPYYDEYTLLHGKDAGTKIYRWNFAADNPRIPNAADIQHHRYSLALVDAPGTPNGKKAYVGDRDLRPTNTVLKMTVACQFDPQPGDAELDPEYAEQIRENEGEVKEYFTHYGGVVYGGCFNSGLTYGDVILTVGSRMIGDRINVNALDSYGDISSLRHNLGRVFGGGYGKDALVIGNTYVNLLTNFVGMNVFGGGCRGNVQGMATINYVGHENSSYVLGAIYGGGLYGSVGVQRTYEPDGVTIKEYGTPMASSVNLFSGSVDKVYGGGCLGNLYGRARVQICDELVSELDHFSFFRLKRLPDMESWEGSRLVVGTVYGGNDVSGSIYLQPLPEGHPDYNASNPELPYQDYSTSIKIYEVPEANHPSSAPAKEGGKHTPGSVEGYNGFPLIGSVYGGSNGEYGTHENARYYTGGKLNLATGFGNEVMTLNLQGEGGSNPRYTAFELPHIGHSHIEITGGTIINVYGGGNASTVTDNADIVVNYNEINTRARAGFADPEELTRVWNTMHLTVDEQIAEVLTRNDDNESIFDYNIFRVFGGNDNAPMGIQPSWTLTRGYVGNVYSGGNFGQMTYTRFDDITGKPVHGLRLSIDSPAFTANNVYGGGRVGDIHPRMPATVDVPIGDELNDADVPDSFYGATLDITDGVIGHVYGGNDVSGNVVRGTNVNIYGAISGDVYCAGNGNYRYKYDPELQATSLVETYDEAYGGRYFILPRREVYGGDSPTKTERLLALNSYRPNVDRAYMNIEGQSEDHVAYVHGSVYCGGNSATINGSHIVSLDQSDIRFNVGDNVRLNNVFLGSNGEKLIDIDMMAVTETLNDLDLSAPNDLPSTAGYEADPYGQLDTDKADKSLYPSLLDVYMSAADVQSVPRDFDLSPDLQNSYIGDFFVGGNSGSMLTNRTIALTFPRNLVIFGKIVGGSNNANLTYKGTSHIGGLTRPLSTALGSNGKALYTDKVYMQVLCKFEPWKVAFTDEADPSTIYLTADVDDSTGTLMFAENKCNIYGGCFTSGQTVGNIHIDLYSDLCAEYADDSAIGQALALHQVGSGSGMLSKQHVIVAGLDSLQRRSFSLIGAGYGEGTSLRGNVRLHMLPTKLHPSRWNGDTPIADFNDHPSATSIFGGSQLGSVLGNTQVAVRDGMVLTNLYGASEASPLYGSTEIMIGWPKYYTCKRTGRYMLNRTDKISRAATENWVTHSSGLERPAIMEEIWLREGEIMTPSLFASLAADQPYVAGYSPESCFELVEDDMPSSYATHNDTPIVHYHDLKWDDISISIGNQHSHISGSNYLGHGNVYGGGFITSGSSVSLAGQNTVRKFRGTDTPSADLLGYGGNSTILVWDNYDNADPTRAVGAAAAQDGSVIKDHISIGTGKYVAVAMKPGQDVMGKYVYDAALGQYIHQSSHVLREGDPMLANTYYEMVCDGGIYGGGRKVFVEGFRSCDVAYYGYADYSPQYPKLLNTFQRIDLLSITDCCLQLQGANDFATNIVDATRYSLTRIGELQLNSSLPAAEPLNPGIREASGLYNILHTTPRMRNYMAFFHDVLYVSAITSNNAFDAPYRGANGQLYSAGDWGGDTGLNPTPPVPPTGADYEHLPATYNYKQYKTNRINNFYANRNLPNQDAHGNDLNDNQNIKALTSLEFDQRNVGTSANMIGMNNGYTLKLQGGVTDQANQDHTYFGPINGVVEVKLLTLAMNEGGGYVFALNQHDDPNHFLETTGNFIFPGAAYNVTNEEDKHYNYIYDDCFPMGAGWDKYYGWHGSSSAMGPRRAATADTGHGDCNEEQEVHYWYVNGTNYYYNVTLTAYSYNEEGDFTLNNNDQLIYFYGINGNSDIKLQDVTWTAHDPSYDSDIQNYASADGQYAKDYRLYLSIDKNPSAMHSTTNAASEHAFVVMLPRADRTVDAGGTASTADAVAAASTPTAYAESETSPNMPLLGISLFDMIDNSGREYYDQHLREDEKARIVITNEVDGVKFQYVVNLTIKYLLGPTITGHPRIENDALPGEYIYVNSYDVTVELDDENMAVTDRSWYIVSPDEDTSTNEAIRSIVDRINTGAPVAAECVNDQKLDNDRQVHIPAFYYRNNWSVIYEVVANNMRFYVRAMQQRPEGEPDAVIPHWHDRLGVHNYHRMRPWDGTSTDALGNPALEDLHFSEGARIYIEDDDDMARFFQWLAQAQNEPTEALPGGTKYANPQYGASLVFLLANDVKMPAGVTNDVKNLRFDGYFQGMGHNIEMGANEAFIGENHGIFYNTGFISDSRSDNMKVFGTNTGKIESCFYYNRADISKGYLIGERKGAVYNSFRTADVDSKEIVNGLVRASLVEFEYGEAAYNLNHYYLKKRYNLATGTPDGDLVAPINWLYGDGEYRFANYDPAGVGTATALRTRAVPNYRDILGIRLNASYEQVRDGIINGTNASMHNNADFIDESRAVRDELGNIVLDSYGQAEGYEPIYPLDYIFFGQNLSMYATKEAYPHANNWDNRVFRASGFYGSKVDQGFHFNANAEALEPDLTAIDFTGRRDAQYPTWNVDYEGDNLTSDRQIWYAPALDLPDPTGENGGLQSFTTGTYECEQTGRPLPENAITRNLLVYNPGNWSVLDAFAEGTTTPASSVYCHLVTADADGARTDYLQLVDCEDFNSPIAFDVNEAVWYRREPSLFATGNDAWEGICLPFTARIAKATLLGGDQSSLRSHGEISHFYGPHAGTEVKADSHEYWLRKFTGVADGKAYFARPGSEDDTAAANPADAIRERYHYSNTFFRDVYGTWYNDSTTHTPQTPQYTPEGLDYDNYPMLTHDMPYIVSFPGQRFREFDLSGEFFGQMFGTEAIPQVITYANFIDHAAGDARTVADRIDISDNMAANRTFTHDGHSFVGTFMHHSVSASEDVIDSDAFGANGSALHRASSTDERTVMPFRCFMRLPASSPAPMQIASRGVDTLVPGDDDDADGDEADDHAGLEFSIDQNVLVITSPYDEDIELGLYDISGRLLRLLTIAPGSNRYPGLLPGTYLAGPFKFRLP